MTMLFERPERNYQVADGIINASLADTANPLPNIFSLIESVSTILDIGAGNGLLGRIFEYIRKPVVIDAVEPNAYAASLIPNCYRTVHEGYVQDLFEVIQSFKYDYVVMADVIEYIADPHSLMDDLVDCLGPNVKVLVSLPNVVFFGVRVALLEGRFDYVDSAILEKTHLRFYKLELASAFFLQTVLLAHSIIYLQRTIVGSETSVLGRWSHLLVRLKLAFDPSASTYQYLFMLRKNSFLESSVQFKGAGCLYCLASNLAFDRLLSLFSRARSSVSFYGR